MNKRFLSSKVILFTISPRSMILIIQWNYFALYQESALFASTSSVTGKRKEKKQKNSMHRKMRKNEKSEGNRRNAQFSLSFYISISPFFTFQALKYVIERPFHATPNFNHSLGHALFRTFQDNFIMDLI